MATTEGQALTAALRRYFSIGTRTRRYRKDGYGDHDRDLHSAMVEAIIYAAQYDSFHATATQQALEGHGAIAHAYVKHVLGHRIDGELARRISEMTPWQFAAMLGDMVDAGVTNTGEGERFFAEMAKAGS